MIAALFTADCLDFAAAARGLRNITLRYLGTILRLQPTCCTLSQSLADLPRTNDH
jgi:hypothetical protein